MNSSFDMTSAVRTFQYPVIAGGAKPGVDSPWDAKEETLWIEGLEQMLAKARNEGRAAGETQARACFEQELCEVRSALGAAIHEFTERRALHLRALEKEAVKLALAIARRVLRRESQVDSSLLLGLVRSSLTELGKTSRVRLFVHPTFADEWREHFQRTEAREETPELVKDSKLHRHECRIESPLGTTVLSLESNLAEIENGLFDLLSASLEDEQQSTVQ